MRSKSAAWRARRRRRNPTRYLPHPTAAASFATTLHPTPWIPREFDYPQPLDLPTGHHLRPIRTADAQIDLPAVMGSRESLVAIYGHAWAGRLSR